jgi:hypothetical protein
VVAEEPVLFRQKQQARAMGKDNRQRKWAKTMDKDNRQRQRQIQDKAGYGLRV